MHEPIAAIFDMDGVLVDSYAAHFLSWRNVLARYNVEFSETQFAQIFGRTAKEGVRSIWPYPDTTDSEIAQVEAQKEAEFRTMIRDDFPIMPGVRDLLESLRASDFSIAIASSGPPENVSLTLEKI